MSGSYSRLSQLVQNLAGTTCDLTLGFSYNPASQITSNTRSNDAYAWTGHGSGTTSSPANGLNQLASFGSTAVSHDANGNLTKDPHTGHTFGYSSENLLTIVYGPGWTGTISYDPLMRLYEAGADGRNRSAYDGLDRIAEYTASNAPFSRFVHGPGIDEPLVEYSGTGLATRTSGARSSPPPFICGKLTPSYQALGRLCLGRRTVWRCYPLLAVRYFEPARALNPYA